MKLSDIIKHTKKFFEKKRKNPVQLENDSNLESNLKFLKVSDKSTPIQISDDTINIQGSLTVNGDSVQTGTDAGATVLNELKDVIYSSGDLTIDSLDKIATLNGLLIEDAQSSVDLRSVGDIYSTTFRDFLVDAGRNIALDSHTGEFIAKKAGTEFSVANSAYAGMILGYRMIGEDNAHESYTMTNSYAVPDADMTVRFVAPPSGAVEVMVQIHANAVSSNRFLYFGLSDNATYNSIGNSYEQLHRMPDETDDTLVQHYWTITGLTAGSTYNYWFGAKISLTSAYLNWGGTASNRYGDFIMKVTALPAATSDFAEYD